MEKIQLKGINTTDVGFMPDGFAKDIINFRMKDGMQPMSYPKRIGTVGENTEKVYFHQASGKYIVVSDTVYATGKDFTERVFEFDSVSKPNSIEFIGNMVCFIMSDRILYALWENDGYIYLGERPETPTVVWKCNPTIETLEEEHSGVVDEDVPYIAVGAYTKLESILNKRGKFNGSILFRYAFRLSDGSYAFHSPVILAEYGGGITILGARPDHNIQFPFETKFIGEDKYKFGAAGYGFTFELSVGTDIEKWKSVITSIDLFVCPLKWYEIAVDKNNNREYYKTLDNKYFAEVIPNAHLFYKYQEFDLKGNSNYILDDVSSDNLAVQQELTDDAFSNNSFGAESSYAYNSRLHIGNVTETLFKGYKGDAYYPSAGNPENGTTLANVYVKIDTDQGEAVVMNTVDMPNGRITPFLSYPDYRAKEMIIYFAGTGKGKRFILKRHKYLNLSYYLSPRQKSGVLYPEILPYTYIDTTVFESISDEQEKNNVLKRKDIIKVSSVNNPVYFPADQTYKPSSGEILAMCSNAVALSQGQFGQFPLIVFSSDGVYAMSVGENNIAYSNTSPVSRDVCINTESVCPIDKGVVFFTDKGVMVSYGSESSLISSVMDGNSPIFSEIEKKIAGSFNVYLPEISFREYLKNATCGYFYKEQEIIISNKEYGYSYVYNMNTDSWCRMNISYMGDDNVKQFINSYPGCEVLSRKGEVFLFNTDDSVADCMIITRPVQFGTTEYKHLWQCALRGLLDSNKAGFYVLGSNDGETFKVIAGRESGRRKRDLICGYVKSMSLKYFVFVVCGSMNTKSRVDYIEYAVSTAHTNRIR